MSAVGFWLLHPITVEALLNINYLQVTVGKHFLFCTAASQNLPKLEIIYHVAVLKDFIVIVFHFALGYRLSCVISLAIQSKKDEA